MGEAYEEKYRTQGRSQQSLRRNPIIRTAKKVRYFQKE